LPREKVDRWGLVREGDGEVGEMGVEERAGRVGEVGLSGGGVAKED
jgi:hypothetical protein